MTEFAPPGSNARMTPAQIKKYIKDMKKAQKIAKEKLNEAKQNGEFDTDKDELKRLEQEIDNL